MESNYFSAIHLQTIQLKIPPPKKKAAKKNIKKGQIEQNIITIKSLVTVVTSDRVDVPNLCQLSLVRNIR